jgi:hypothetical protein
MKRWLKNVFNVITGQNTVDFYNAKQKRIEELIQEKLEIIYEWEKSGRDKFTEIEKIKLDILSIKIDLA